MLGLLLLPVFRVLEGAVKGITIRMPLSTERIRMRSQAWVHWSKDINSGEQGVDFIGSTACSTE